MRSFQPAAIVASLALAACGAKVHVDDSPYDLDTPAAAPVAPPQAVAWDLRPEAPAGPGVRTGTIARPALVAVLDAGPGAFLSGFEVAPELDGQRFAGWRLVQWMPGQRRFAGLDLAPGDILLAINGQTLSRPDQLETLWTSLRTADQLVCDLGRGANRFQLTFAILPPLGAAPPPTAPPEPAVPTGVVPTAVPPMPAPTPTPAPTAKLHPRHK
jgi:hypothetical protein